MEPCSTGQVGVHYAEQIPGGEMGEKEKNSLCTVERGRPEEAKKVRNRLMWVTCLPRGSGCHPCPVATKDHFWVSGPTTIRVYVDIHDPFWLSKRRCSIWATTCVHVGVQGPCFSWGHSDLGGLCCHPWPW